MRVTVKIGELLWHLAGRRQVELELPADASAADAMAQLAERLPALAVELPPGGVTRSGLPYYVFVNRRLVGHTQLRAHRLKDGDSLHVLSPTAGG
jgi:molybdopterin converting factor small subunit